MSDLLKRIQAKKKAEAAAAAPESTECTDENCTDQGCPKHYATPDSEHPDNGGPEHIPSVQEEPEPASEPATTKKPQPEAEVLMGITVEDLQERIAHVFEHAKTAEKHEIKEDMDGLKRAIHANPSIVQHLLPHDIGKMVGTLRKIHSEARIEATNTPAKKKAAKSAEAKAAKEMLKKPMSKEDLDSLMDEL